MSEEENDVTSAKPFIQTAIEPNLNGFMKMEGADFYYCGGGARPAAGGAAADAPAAQACRRTGRQRGERPADRADGQWAGTLWERKMAPTGRARTLPPSSSMAADLAPAPSTVWPVGVCERFSSYPFLSLYLFSHDGDGRRCGEEGQQAGARGRGRRRHRARPAIPIFSPRNVQEGRSPLLVNSQELGESGGGGGLPRPPDELAPSRRHDSRLFR
uniref:Uncharacterized protein n=1 Tax=Oryza rufipogon TaxID=4529 RepID=A0A0E0QYF4_ORYRU